MLRFMTYLCCTPVVTGAAFPRTVMEIASLPARLHVRASNDRTVITDPDTGHTFVPGETSTDRTIYNAVALFCVIVLAVFLGFRLRALRNNVFRKCNFTSMLVVALYIFGLGFIICASIVQTGQGLYTHQLCYSAAMICLVFYTGNKLTIYIFLLERARIVRAPFVPRWKDHIWLLGMLIICGGFGTIAIVGYMSPVVELSKLDGRCRIGLPPRVSFPLLFFDVAVNFLLTGVFFWLLRPVLDSYGLWKTSAWFGSRPTMKAKKNVRRRESELESAADGVSLKSAMNTNIKILLRKCLIGSTLVMLPTVANMAQFYIMNSRELGWVCLTICTLDVSWGVIIVNWLTIGSAKAEDNLTTLMSQRTLRGNCNDPGNPSDSNPNQLDIGLSTHNHREEKTQEVHTRQVSATTAEVPVFFKAASLKDEGRLLGNDGCTESWIEEVEASLHELRTSRLKESERTGEGGAKGWAEGSMSRTTVNDRIVREERIEDSLNPLRIV